MRHGLLAHDDQDPRLAAIRLGAIAPASALILGERDNGSPRLLSAATDIPGAIGMSA
jgi:hypothetical protein